MNLENFLQEITTLKGSFTKNSTLFLSGGGSEEITKYIDNFFIKNILPNKKKIKILYIPIAKSGDMNVYKKSLKWLKDKFLKIDTAHELEFILCTKIEKINSLEEYDVVYLGGGNTYRLLYLFKKYNFNKKLIEYVKLGGIVYGASAGVVIFGEKISTFIEDKYLSENLKHGYVEEIGLSLFKNCSFLTHFEKEDKKKACEFLKKNKNHNVICIPPGVALVIKKDFFKVVGLEKVSIYKSNSVIKLLS